MISYGADDICWTSIEGNTNRAKEPWLTLNSISFRDKVTMKWENTWFLIKMSLNEIRRLQDKEGKLAGRQCLIPAGTNSLPYLSRDLLDSLSKRISLKFHLKLNICKISVAFIFLAYYIVNNAITFSTFVVSPISYCLSKVKNFLSRHKKNWPGYLIKYFSVPIALLQPSTLDYCVVPICLSRLGNGMEYLWRWQFVELRHIWPRQERGMDAYKEAL